MPPERAAEVIGDGLSSERGKRWVADAVNGLVGNLLARPIGRPADWLGAETTASLNDGVATAAWGWTQQQVPREKLGRVMSVIMMASQGLFPISAAVAGVLAGWNLTWMLLGAGSVMVAITFLGMASRTVRRLGHA